MVNSKLKIPQNQIIALAQRYGLTEISLFGSVLTDDFGPDSDIDVLIEFLPNSDATLFDIVEIKYELESLFEREVDVVEKQGLLNPFRRKSILTANHVIYKA